MSEPRPAAGPGFAAWGRSLVPRVPTLVRAYLPGAPIDARRRELLAATVAAGLGCHPLERLHRDWHDLLGPPELSEVDDDVAAWAVATALAGPGPSAELGLPRELGDAARRSAMALVAHTAASAASLEAAASVVERLRRPGGPSTPAGPTPSAPGRDPRGRVDAARALGRDLVASLAGLALVAPTAAVGAVVSTVGRAVPAPPELEVGPDPNLLAQLLAETLPTWFGSAWGRTLVAGLPVAIPIGVRSGRTGATVRVGERRLVVANGIADDVWAVFDGEVDALVRAGSLSLTRELRADRLPR